MSKIFGSALQVLGAVVSILGAFALLYSILMPPPAGTDFAVALQRTFWIYSGLGLIGGGISTVATGTVIVLLADIRALLKGPDPDHLHFINRI